ncbi:glycoprotein-N-acetylgalactosamine 3-beta-galactosyltransferase [Tanacetum coccineum]|uniref:Glycoprotein-N-acetylgalactosamine 3-beta-galactosyltransferase n=1 Tax=Tanacetum coccineum TaxID=301880 RepID=A0ABQ5D0J3_9ASTR
MCLTCVPPIGSHISSRIGANPTNIFQHFQVTTRKLSSLPHESSNTNISHLVFGLLGSTQSWHYRKPYIESWWHPNVTRVFLYLDTYPTNDLLPLLPASPPFRVSDDISKLLNDIKHVAPIMARMVHGVIEVFREEKEGVRWYIMGDDDSMCFVDNLVDVLSTYDHTKTNHELSIGKNVSMTAHQGLHHIDLRGDISGLFSSHPKAPLLSLHHINHIDPFFRTMDRSESAKHLMKAANVDQSRLLQQTICYKRKLSWSFSLSWGFSVHIYEKIIPRSILKIPLETFKPWSWLFKPPFYMFNTRPLSNDPCATPHVFSFDSIKKINNHEVLTNYVRMAPRGMPSCGLAGNHSADMVSRIEVLPPVTKPNQVVDEDPYVAVVRKRKGGKDDGLGLVACATENVSDPLALELGSTLHFKFYAGNESLKENSDEQATQSLQIIHLPKINTYEKTDLKLMHKLVEETLS